MEALVVKRECWSAFTGMPARLHDNQNLASPSVRAHVEWRPQVWMFDSLRTNTTQPRIQDEFAAVEGNLYALCEAKRDRSAIAEALDYFDDCLISRRFPDCERALRRLQVTKLAPSVLVAILGITLRAQNLQNRASFFERAFQEIARQKSKKYARELLAKYR